MIALQVETIEDPVECAAHVLLPCEVFGALYARDPGQARQLENNRVFTAIISFSLVQKRNAEP